MTRTTLEPRSAIVTASDSRIGRETSLVLAEAGMDVGVTRPVDGGMPQRGPQAGSLLNCDDGRRL